MLVLLRITASTERAVVRRIVNIDMIVLVQHNTPAWFEDMTELGKHLEGVNGHAVKLMWPPNPACLRPCNGLLGPSNTIVGDVNASNAEAFAPT
ncbi:MAG: hypothetical protein Q9172_004218 [Xanthocarpia lactea]